MSMLLLCNSVGATATTFNLLSGTSAAQYDQYDLISGPRSTMWRSETTTTGVQPIYHVDSDYTPTHYVMTRADLMLTQGTSRVRPRQKNASSVYSYITGVDYNPLTSVDLMGPTFQDLCFAVTPTSFRGFGIECLTLGADAEATQFSKLYVCAAFDFGTNPSQSPPPGWQLNANDSTVQLFIPQHGYQPFEVERRISLFWTAVTQDKIQEFKALPQLLRWPLFIYDENGDVFDWKLEHVVIENYQEEILADNTHNIGITFFRLKHY